MEDHQTVSYQRTQRNRVRMIVSHRCTVTFPLEYWISVDLRWSSRSLHRCNRSYPTQSYAKLTDIRSRYGKASLADCNFRTKKAQTKSSALRSSTCVSAQTKRLIYERNSWFKWCWLAHAVMETGSISMACCSNNVASRSGCHPRQRCIIIGS